MINDNTGFDLIWVIVNFGKGSSVLQTAKKCGATGGTVVLAKGTANSSFISYLGLTEIRKEIVLMACNKETSKCVLETLNEKFQFEKPKHGIAFTTALHTVIGSVGCILTKSKKLERGDESMYCSITVIVEKGKAEDVVDAATAAGSKGGTIINARGSGIHETSKLFFMDIEPEKEMVLILSEKCDSDAIISSIREKIDIKEPGKGIIFVQDVNKVYGLAK